MNITPNGAGTYLVSSQSRDGEHIVDLLAGTCSCEWFNSPKNPDRSCAHLEHVRATASGTVMKAPGMGAMLGARRGWICPCGKMTTKKIGRKCSTCKSKEWNAKHPLRRVYLNLRGSAKRKGKSFTLSYEVLEAKAIVAGWDTSKDNRSADGLSVDRIRSNEGYSDTNIRIILYGRNSQKLNETHDYDEERNEWIPKDNIPY